MTIYQNLTVGEKRSMTSSLKKAAEMFAELHKEDYSSFDSQNDFVSAFYTYWLDYSTTNRLSWCYEKKEGMKNHHLQNGFQSEMEEKIMEMFAEQISMLPKEIASIAEVVEIIQKVTPIRSKKKRHRKKFEKKMQLVMQA